MIWMLPSRRFGLVVTPLAATLLSLLGLTVLGPNVARGADPSHEQARSAMHRAVSFFREHAASEGGGYVYRVTVDGKQREGESKVGPSTAWLEPPGTPAVGMAYLEAYRLTRDPLLKEAAIETAQALVRGQLLSGGWDNKIEFDPEERKRYAYRVDEQPGKFNLTTLDDDKSQSAARFLMQLDRALDFQNESIHEASLYALESFLQAQYANGAWPQRYEAFPDPEQHQPRPASIPDQWPREFPKLDYKTFYTLNDNTISDMVETMLQAHAVYDDARYLDAARRAGQFFVLAQLPEPQPGWAQQYDETMQPRWARKFEPAAITGGESQGVMMTLLKLYRVTGESDFLTPVPKAIRYYRKLQLPDGRLARFYELGTDRPLYFTKDYQLTYSDADMPTHYAFQVSSKLDRIEREHRQLTEQPWQPPAADRPEDRAPSLSLTDRLAREAEAVIESLDQRGAWVEKGRMRTHDQPDGEQAVIDSRTFANRLVTLARYVAATAQDAP